MYPAKQSQRTLPMISEIQSNTALSSRSSRSLVRMRACTVGLLGADLAAFVAATLLASAITGGLAYSPYTRAFENVASLGTAWHGWGTFLVLVSLLSYLGGRGHYTVRVPFWTQLGDVAVGTAVALSCDTFLTIAIYSRPVLVEGLLRWVLFCPCLLILRMATRGVLRAVGLWSLRTLIVAGAAEIKSTRAALSSDTALGYQLVGAVTSEIAAALPDPDLVDMISARDADFVVVAIGGGNPQAERAVLSALRRTGLSIGLVPALRGLPVIGFRQHYFLGHDIVMLVSRTNLARPSSRLLKAAFDQVCAILLLFLLAPLMVVLAVLIRADGGPAFYRHRRIGAGGRVFDCIKFRSMAVNADKVLRQVIANDPTAAAEWVANQKLRDDPRVTKLGLFLRRSSLDELPQIFNVLRGEMSLVGPRPIVQTEVVRYGNDIEYYYAAKPGLTGLWQVSGRSDMPYASRVKLDVWYVANWTLWHDIAILFKTIPAVFLQRGAL